MTCFFKKIRVNQQIDLAPSMGVFWNTQPVDRGTPEGIIDNRKLTTNVPTPLPEGLYWSKIGDIAQIVAFLDKFYVEDASFSYRLLYPPEFFEFLFVSPNHKEEYSLGMFSADKLVGYVLAREHHMVLRDQPHRIVSVNFLCLAKEYRNKQFAPLLIKEITRIANLNGIFQAIFTAEKDYGFSIMKAYYYHYPMNGEKLLKSDVIESLENARRIPECRKGTRIASDSDLAEIKILYGKMCSDFTVFEKFDDECEFSQIFKSKEKVLCTIYNKEAGEFASFYIVHTRCLASDILLKRAYLYYWYGSVDIIKDLIHIAYSLGIDMLDALDIAQNQLLIKELNFSEGTGSLKYHIFNIKEELIKNEKLNFILF